MRCAPLALLACKRAQKDFGNDNYGDDEGDSKTQDGTIDVHGRQASRRRTGGWKGASFCLVQTSTATLSIFAITSNLVQYMTSVLHQNNQAAAKNVSNWTGTLYITPLIIAFIADSYAGRFIGCLIAAAINITGFVILTLAGTLHAFRPPQCPTEDLNCEKPTLGQSVFFYAGLYVSALGAGGLAGTLTTLGADQFDENDEAEAKKRSSYFNVNLVAILAGSFVALTFFIYIQDNVSAGLSWGLATVVLLMGTVVFLLGKPVYRYKRTGGNPLTRIAQVIVAFSKKANLKVHNTDDLYEIQDSEIVKGSRRTPHTNRYRFLDKAALLTDRDKVGGGQILPSPWRVCTVTQVEELKYLLSVLPIFLTCVIFSTCWGQVLTLFIEQGYTMDCKLGSFTIPAASVDVFESLSVFFCALVYDLWGVPLLRKWTGHPRGMTDLKRIGFGLFLSIISMIIAAVVDTRRIHSARVHGLLDNPYEPIPMSVFYLVPQYFVIGAAEVFTYVGLLEFFYDQAPDGLRTLAISLELLTIALGLFVSTLLLTIVGHITKRDGKPGWVADNLNRARLDLWYWMLAVLGTISLLLYILFASFYEYKAVAEAPTKPAAVEENSKTVSNDLAPI